MVPCLCGPSHRPLGDYVKRMFASPEYASALRHGSKTVHERGVKPGFHADVIDGRAYKALSERVKLTEVDIVLAFVTDGVQPFKEDHKYSIHPLAFTPLSISPDLRYD